MIFSFAEAGIIVDNALPPPPPLGILPSPLAVLISIIPYKFESSGHQLHLSDQVPYDQEKMRKEEYYFKLLQKGKESVDLVATEAQRHPRFQVDITDVLKGKGETYPPWDITFTANFHEKLILEMFQRLLPNMPSSYIRPMLRDSNFPDPLSKVSKTGLVELYSKEERKRYGNRSLQLRQEPLGVNLLTLGMRSMSPYADNDVNKNASEERNMPCDVEGQQEPRRGEGFDSLSKSDVDEKVTNKCSESLFMRRYVLQLALETGKSHPQETERPSVRDADFVCKEAPPSSSSFSYSSSSFSSSSSSSSSTPVMDSSLSSSSLSTSAIPFYSVLALSTIRVHAISDGVDDELGVFEDVDSIEIFVEIELFGVMVEHQVCGYGTVLMNSIKLIAKKVSLIHFELEVEIQGYLFILLVYSGCQSCRSLFPSYWLNYLFGFFFLLFSFCR
tara:strand:+ start:1684 stop:3018 length:1335 start_codon:yes stop_codon:yes gene_type:complete